MDNRIASEAEPPPAGGHWRALALLAAAELLGMSLWFSASASVPALKAEWLLTDSAAAWLTLAVQLGFAVRNARDIEQVIDEPGHVPDLPFDHPLGPGHGGIIDVLPANDVECIEDGSQGIAQLMGQHRQEFVLAPVRFGQPFQPLPQPQGSWFGFRAGRQRAHRQTGASVRGA